MKTIEINNFLTLIIVRLKSSFVLSLLGMVRPPSSSRRHFDDYFFELVNKIQQNMLDEMKLYFRFRKDPLGRLMAATKTWVRIPATSHRVADVGFGRVCRRMNWKFCDFDSDVLIRKKID